MGLSRLDNFLKSVRGTILYVDPNSLDSTDSIENTGNSLTRPFKTIQRALIEASRFSYQRGLNNDRFGKTTILLYPGDHIVDNRPGWIPDGSNNFKLRDGTTSNDFPPFDLTSNFDVTTSSNTLYKLNSIHGGVIVPRGTSIVGLDLRKTKIRPKYVPDPTNDNIERSTIFRVTGGCYFWQFSIFDADPNGQCFIDYTTNLFVPNFSHHKLTCFEYADGTNDVSIDDTFIDNYTTDRTDLDMYYEKVGLAYGQSSGRAIEPDYPSSSLDIQPKIDEYRIVGPTGGEVGITSIKSGDGVTSSTTITVTTASVVSGLDVDTAFRIRNVSESTYNGQFVVTERVDDTNFKYQVQNTPILALPSVTNASLTLSSDTVTSASPYIFNISLRSVYGMCGVLADGDKASGFKSMVIAQFTGIGLQKDDNAFVLYNSATGEYDDSTKPGNETISNNSRAIFKPSYRNFHIKTINEAFIQNVSIFAIGYAEHFSTDSGGDQSVTNSNSNFGSKALVASGFRKNAFPQDDFGYITHIIPPKELPLTETAIEFNAIDVNKTVGVASTGNLYLYNQTNADIPPENVLEGYRIGARENDALKVLISSSGSSAEYSARIVMSGSQSSSEKKFTVARIGTANNVTNGNTLNLTSNHTFYSGESVRILSDNGQLPDGIVPNTVYYAITNTVDGTLSTSQIKLAKTETDSTLASNAISINDRGGILSIVSRVTDKNSGDLGHPIQYDSTNGQWYIQVATASTENNIYSTIVGLGSTSLGAATPRTYIKRKQDNRTTNDTLYRVRYVIPKSTGAIVARPPVDAFIIQESNTSIGQIDEEIETYFGNFGSGYLLNVNEQRNFRFIANAEWSSNIAKITTELPHNLSVGSKVELVNIKSSNNLVGIANSGFNGTFDVIGISSAKQFNVNIPSIVGPGTFSNNTSARTTSLPYFKRKQYKETYYIYRTQESQKYVAGQQDGVYYITILNASNSPTVAPFTEEKFSQPVKELYPQVNRDNPKSDPDETICAASSSLIGEVVVNDVRNSITKETIGKFLKDSDVGVGLTDIVSSIGNTSHTIHTNIDHGLNRITRLTLTTAGAGYGSGTAGDLYNAKLVGFAGSITGEHATAKITVDGSGTITDVKIMDGGSAYGIGNTLAVVGVGTTTGYTQAVVTVTGVYDNVGDTVRISGVSSEVYAPFNDVYRITNVQVGAAKSFIITSTSAIGVGTTTGIGATDTSNAYVYLTGEAIRISAFSYDNTTGIALVTSINNHGLKVDSKVRIVGANESLYNGDFVVTENVNNTSFKINIGVSANAPTATGNLFAYREGITSNDGVITVDNENLNGRMSTIYAGITTTLSSPIINATTDQINLTSVSSLDVNIGDYLMIDDEIMRVRATTSTSSIVGATNPITVFRGILGSKAATHSVGAVVRKIEIKPIELRRHSIIRASGHTFEYVGFGPGNYSTAFPDKQDRQISPQEELLSQSTRKNGGINFYTGMNDKGISYAGNKKLSTVTGLEEIFDTPIQTITGEDIGTQQGLNVITPTEGSFTRSIRVEGGSDGKATSEFNGPVIFSNKVTSTSTRGIEAFSLFLQGDSTVSRKYTVGIATPALAGNPGDIIYLDNPTAGGYVGWIYTNDNDWYRFGAISLSKTLNIGLFDQVGIATTSPGTAKLLVGSGTTQFSVDENGVGIGTTANTFKLHVNGNTNIIGTCYATSFSGDGSALTNLNAAALGWTQISGGIYNTALNNVGIGTSVPRFSLEVGAVGTSSTSLYVNGVAQFVGIITANNVFVSGIITATGAYDLNSSSGRITAGIITTTTLVVGTGGTTITTSGPSVGIGTTVPRAKLDVEGLTRLKTYTEVVQTVSSSSNVVTLDLSQAQTFDLTLTENVNQFTVTNPPSGSSSFTIKISQNSTGGYTVDIDDIRNSGGTALPVYWSGGGVLPIVTPTANRSDIYSFKTFDGGLTWYGVVIGQNFVN
jgi:hypothetical protein